MTITIPDGAHYVVVHCVPAGEATKVDCSYSAGLDPAAALVLIDLGRMDLAQIKQQADTAAGTQRLMTPRDEAGTAEAGGLTDVARPTA